MAASKAKKNRNRKKRKPKTEQVQLQAAADIPSEPAGLRRRFGAMCYDLLLVIAIWLVVVGVMVTLNDSNAVLGIWPRAVTTFFAFVFFAYFWTRFGRTLGMQAWRLRVQNPDGSRISLIQAMLRFMAAVPALLLAGLGYWWAKFDDQHRTWPDLLSGSQVIVLSKDDEARF